MNFLEQEQSLQDIINSMEFQSWLLNYEQYLEKMYEIANSSPKFTEINIDDFILFVYYTSSKKLNGYV